MGREETTVHTDSADDRGPGALSREAVLEAGLRLGLPCLSVSAVAGELGVSRAAIHRYVSGRHGLEELVGEHLVSSLPIPEDRGQPDATLLLELALSLRSFCLALPGMATYLATRFPRSEASAQVLEDICALLVSRGYRPASALLVENTVANIAVALIRSETEAVEFMSSDLSGFDAYVEQIERVFSRLPTLSEGWPRVKSEDFEAHFTWTMQCVIAGVLATVQPETA